MKNILFNSHSLLSAKSYIFFFLFLLLGRATTLYAQQDPHLSEMGNFRIDYIKGCAPLTVNMQEERDAPRPPEIKVEYRLKYEGEIIKYNQAADPLVPFTYTLDNPGVYYIFQWQENTTIPNSGELDSIKVEVIESKTPVFQAYNCGANKVTVKVEPEGVYDYYIAKEDDLAPGVVLNSGNNYQNQLTFSSIGPKIIKVEGRFESTHHEVFHDKCRKSSTVIDVENLLADPVLSGLNADLETKLLTINYKVPPFSFQVLEVKKGNTGTFTPVDTLDPIANEVSLLNPGLGTDFFCYRITTHNFCSGTKIYSEAFCTADLKEVPFEDGNKISYRTASSTDLQNISLLKEGQEIHSFGNAVIGSFSDMAVNCQTTYHYSLQISYAEGSSTTSNLPVTTKIEGALPQVENVVSFWENGSPVFRLPLSFPSEGAEYLAYKGPIRAGKMVAGSKEDEQLKLPASGGKSCYFFTYKDACGNQAASSQEVCALYLFNTSTQPDVLELNWNQYSGYKEGVANYRLEKLDSNGQLREVVYEGPGTSYDLGVQPLEESGSIYIVKALPNNPIMEESSSNNYVFKIMMDGYFPNAFTPDGDGINDHFKAEGKFVKSAVLEIFNSWGELIYRTEDREKGWDGTAKGSPAPQGTYLFKALIKTEDGKEISKKGSVFLLRR